MRRIWSAPLALTLASSLWGCSVGVDSQDELRQTEQAFGRHGHGQHRGHDRHGHGRHGHDRHRGHRFHRGHHKHHRHDKDCEAIPEGDTPLTQAAHDAGRFMGAAVIPAAAQNNPQYHAALTSEFTYVTAENAMKWGSLQVDETTWDFTEADAFVQAAKEADQKIKGHALVWHQQLPSFVTTDLSARELKKMIRKHIKATTKRYRDDVDAWDVVNEAIADDGTLRDSVFLQVLGPDYIEDAFQEAAKHAKKGRDRAELIYNDYGIITQNPKSDGVYALLSELKSKRVPIDAIGFQGHLDARFAPSTEDIVANFRRFADLGLKINISELDVRVSGLSGSDTEKFAVQQQIYHSVAAACVQVRACKAITVWGVSDAYTWLAGERPLILDDDFSRKPSYRGLVDGFLGLPPDAFGAPNLVSSGSFETDAAGWGGFGTPGVELTDVAAASGNQALLSSGRTASWQGPAFALTDIVQPGFEYSAEAFARISGAATAPVGMWLKTVCDGEEQYTEIENADSDELAFSSLSGAFAIPYCSLEEATLYFQGPDAGVDLLVDDVTVRQTAEPLGEELVAGNFDLNTNGWFPFGPATLSLTTDAQSGAGALLTSARTDTWQGPATSLTSSVLDGATYRVSGFTKISEGSSDIRLTVKTVCDGVESYDPVSTVTAETGVWTEMTGTYQVPLCDSLSEVTLYAEGPAAGVDILLDEVSVRQRLAVPVLTPPTDPNIVGNGTFEDGTSGWFSWAGSVATSSFAHSGAQSLAVTGSSVGPAATELSGVVEAGATYNLSFWVSLAGADSASVHVTRAMDCGGGTEYGWVTNNTSVIAGEWAELTGFMTIPEDCSLAQVQLYVEGTPSGATGDVTLYVDDVVIAPPSNLVENGDFESDTSGWYSWNDTTLSTSTAYAHSGSQSLLASGSGLGPAASDFATILEPGQTYTLSYWVLLDGADSGVARVTRAMDCGDGVGTTYAWVSGTGMLTRGEWVELSGSFSVPAGCDMSQLQLYVEGGDLVNPDATVQLYVDDVSVGQ